MEKTYSLSELRDIACKFAMYYSDECLEVVDEEIEDSTGFPIEMTFDKFLKTEL